MTFSSLLTLVHRLPLSPFTIKYKHENIGVEYNLKETRKSNSVL